MLALNHSTRTRLAVEPLEDRCTPATLTVTTLVDVVNAGDGVLSLREAVLDAAPGDTVVFQSNVTGSVGLESALAIDKSLTISGPGRDKLTLLGGGADRHFSVAGGVTAALSGLTLANGYLPDAYLSGGGSIYNDGGFLTVSDCAFADNFVFGTRGGAIYSSGGSLTLSGCAFTDNTVDGIAGTAADGGAIANTGGPLTVTNCTFSGNTAFTGPDQALGGPSTAPSVLDC